MFSFLRKPYPFPAPSLKAFLVNTSVSTFVGLFLVLFQPFGLSELKLETKNLLLWGYALTCFIATNFITFAILPLIRTKKTEESWNMLKEILLLMFLILFIAVANVAYSSLIGFGHFAIGNFLYAIMYTSLIGIFPIVLSVTISYNRLKNKSESEAAAINSILSHLHTTSPNKQNKEGEEETNDATATIPAKTELVLLAENNADRLVLHPSQLLCIESADNYSQVFYSEKGQLKKSMLRGSLKLMESQLTAHNNILRCHRAWIVNLHNVENAVGNAQGYKLSLPLTGFTVPVSRAYVEEVTLLFQQQKK